MTARAMHCTVHTLTPSHPHTLTHDPHACSSGNTSGVGKGQAAACVTAADELTRAMAAHKGRAIRVVAGLDGYVDNIIDVVDSRTGPAE
jgi:hypothetical protein